MGIETLTFLISIVTFGSNKKYRDELIHNYEKKRVTIFIL